MLSLFTTNAPKTCATIEDALSLKYIMFWIFVGLSLLMLITILLVVFTSAYTYRLIGRIQPSLSLIVLMMGIVCAQDQTRVPAVGIQKLYLFNNDQENGTLLRETILTTLYDPYLRISLQGTHLFNNSHLIIQTLDFKDYYFFPEHTDFDNISVILPSPVRFRMGVVRLQF